MTLIKDNVKTVNVTEDLLKAPYGMQGADIIASSIRAQGAWYCIMAIEDNTTLDWTAMGTTTDVNWEHPNVVSDFDLDLITGVPYYGDFKAIKLVDGKLIAYKK
tara:strand:+ start:1164 stop:1475 length:312 start_codon:yes stop_codon:yes gene_type:complete